MARVGPIHNIPQGTGAFTMTANTKELTALQRWMTVSFNKAARDGDVVVPFIRRWATTTNENFRNEMWPSRGQDWARLTPWTVQERELRGYGGEHPILQQSGQLKQLAAEAYQGWAFGKKSLRTRSAQAPYGEETSLTATGNIVNTSFTATISGERVKNQAAYYTSRRDGSRVGVPPRPFWGLTSEILQQGLSGKGESYSGTAWPSQGSMAVFLRKWHELKTGLTR